MAPLLSRSRKRETTFWSDDDFRPCINNEWPSDARSCDVCRPIPSVAPVMRKLLDLRDDDVDMDILTENREAADTLYDESVAPRRLPIAISFCSE